MAYVITSTCIKDSLCVDACPTDCIHPKQDEPGFAEATQMYVDPRIALTAAPAYPCARRLRSSRLMSCRSSFRF